MAQVRVEVLGPLRVLVDGAAVSTPGINLHRLLLRLTLAGARTLPADLLADAVWGDDQPANPRGALHTLVARARRALGAGASALQQVSGGYRLDVASTDAEERDRLLALARAELAAQRPHSALARCAQARALSRGFPLGELADLDWARTEAERLNRVVDRLDGVEAESLLAGGQADRAVEILEPRLSEDHTREDVTELLAYAYLACGRPADALVVIDTTRRRLAEQLGTDLSPNLSALHLRLLRADAAPAPAVTGASPGSSSLVQAPPARPAPPLAAAPDHRRRLPGAVTSFVGRRRELDTIAAALARERLVTLVGPGGAGKTRTSLEVARAAEAQGRAVCVVELAPTDDEHLLDAVMRAVGIGRTASSTSALEALPHSWERLVDHVRARPMLLVVDNCEHLIDTAAATIEDLLGACPHLQVLATSREPLAIDGESTVTLSSMELPAVDASVERAEASSAVELFVTRAQAARPGFTLDEDTCADVVHLVRALDGLPLALELAAARLRVLPLRDVCDGLDDRFALLVGGSRTKAARHRSLRAVVDWSWQLLAVDERLVLERISVLPAGATRDSARHVCAGDGVDPGAVPQLLSALVDKSLLVIVESDSGTRYTQLETIREFGLERLTATGGLAAVKRRFARHLGHLTHRLSNDLIGPRQRAAVRRLDAEAGNISAALHEFIAEGDIARARRQSLDLVQIGMVTGRLDRMGDSTGDVLALGGALDAQWWVLRAVHVTMTSEGEGVPLRFDESSPAVVEVIDGLVRHADVDPGIALAAALMLYFSGDRKQADDIVERTLAAGAGNRTGMFHTVRATFAQNRADLAQVRRDIKVALDLGDGVDPWTRSSALSMRATLHIGAGDVVAALTDVDAALDCLDGFDDSDDRLPLLARRSLLLIALGRLHEARTCVRAASAWQVAGPLASLRGLIVAAIELSIAHAAGERDELRRRRDDLERLLNQTTGALGPGLGQVRSMTLGVICVAWLEDDPVHAAAVASQAVAEAFDTADQPVIAAAAAALAVAGGRDDPTAAELLGLSTALRGCPDDTQLGVPTLLQALRARLGRRLDDIRARAQRLDAGAASERLRHVAGLTGARASQS